MDEFVKNNLGKVAFTDEVQGKFPTLLHVNETEKSDTEDDVEEKEENYEDKLEEDDVGSVNLLERRSSTSCVKYLPFDDDDVNTDAIASLPR